MIKVNHDYFIVELNTYAPPAEMFEWLQVRLGPGNGDRWMYKSPKLFFANKQDHTMFLLRWG